MPFITQDRRSGALTGEHNEPGDKCYRHYKELIDMWKQSRRWTTIDAFARRVWEVDEQRAAALALLVFMHLHGIDYELEKQTQNGDIL